MLPEKEFIRRIHAREKKALGGILKERGYPGQVREVRQAGSWVIAVFEFDGGKLYSVTCDFSGREVGLYGAESTELPIWGEGNYRLEAYIDVVRGGKVVTSRDLGGEVTWLTKIPERIGEGEVLFGRKLNGVAGLIGRVTYSWSGSARPEFEVTMEDPPSMVLSGKYEYRNGRIFLVDSSPKVEDHPWRLASPVGFDLAVEKLFDPRCNDLRKYPFWIKRGILE
jgi:hypothetical protein